jgi:hypothetical protein
MCVYFEFVVDANKYKLCPTKKWAVAWIQSFLELVYRQRG